MSNTLSAVGTKNRRQIDGGFLDANSIDQRWRTAYGLAGGADGVGMGGDQSVEPLLVGVGVAISWLESGVLVGIGVSVAKSS